MLLVIEVLRKGPLVPFEVGDLVAPVAGMCLLLLQGGKTLSTRKVTVKAPPPKHKPARR